MLQVNTSCQHCIFKTTMKTKVGDVQTDCKLDRIRKFKEKGVKVELTKDKYFVIHKRFCSALRQSGWARKQENPVEAVRKEIQLKLDIIILVVDHETILDDIEYTIKTVKLQTLIPTTVRVIINNDNVKPVEAFDLLTRELSYIETYVDDVRVRASDGTRVSLLKTVDMAADKCENTYYAIFKAGFTIPKTFVEDIDRAINDDLDNFCLLEPVDEINGLVVERELHRILLGNKESILENYADGVLVGDSIIDKAKFTAEKTHTQHAIRKVSTICKMN